MKELRLPALLALGLSGFSMTLACGSSSSDATNDPSSTSSSGSTSSGASGTSTSSSGASSGNTSSGSSGTSSSGDGGPKSDGGTDGSTSDPLAPQPPAGATVCGSGAITSGDFATACQAPSLILDYWANGTKFPRSCSAVTFTSASYTVWCTVDTAYVHVRYVGLRATGALSCLGGTALDLSAVYEAGNHGGDLANGALSAYRGAPYQMFDAQTAIDAATWLTTARDSKSATIWLTPFQEPGGKCGDPGSGYRTVVGGAIAKWQ